MTTTAAATTTPATFQSEINADVLSIDNDAVSGTLDTEQCTSLIAQADQLQATLDADTANGSGLSATQLTQLGSLQSAIGTSLSAAPGSSTAAASSSQSVTLASAFSAVDNQLASDAGALSANQLSSDESTLDTILSTEAGDEKDDNGFLTNADATSLTTSLANFEATLQGQDVKGDDQQQFQDFLGGLQGDVTGGQITQGQATGITKTFDAALAQAADGTAEQTALGQAQTTLAQTIQDDQSLTGDAIPAAQTLAGNVGGLLAQAVGLGIYKQGSSQWAAINSQVAATSAAGFDEYDALIATPKLESSQATLLSQIDAKLA